MDPNTPLDSEPDGLMKRFANRYGGKALLAQAPGRVNLIGEHTDYNEGFVLPAAIEFQTRIAIGKRADRGLVVTSENYGERIELNLDKLPEAPRGHWSDYVTGVVRLMKIQVGELPGANVLLNGNVPQGAGLSSSASLEVAVCKGFLEVMERTLDDVVIAKLCQQAENEFIGARCGIMDQFISVHGRKDHALRIDCRNLESRLVPIPADTKLVICNTMVRHSHAEGEYNERRTECERAAHFFAERLPQVKSLRDVSIENFERFADELPEVIRKRCYHVLGENARVLEASDALERGDLKIFGRLMGKSHVSLRDDFQVSSQELDLMVELAKGQRGVYGSRMTGGGFGGCTINLVQQRYAEEFKQNISEAYKEKTGREPEIYISSAADGASRLA